MQRSFTLFQNPNLHRIQRVTFQSLSDHLHTSPLLAEHVLDERIQLFWEQHSVNLVGIDFIVFILLYFTLEAFPDLDALPLHQRAAAGPSSQKSRSSSGGNHPRYLQHGLSRLWCLLLGLHARVPQRLSGCGLRPTSCSSAQFQAWTGNNNFSFSHFTELLRNLTFNAYVCSDLWVLLLFTLKDTILIYFWSLSTIRMAVWGPGSFCLSHVKVSLSR